MAVVDARGFTKAAESLSITQPALSASVSKLEAELGVRLLDRSRTRAIPTREGLKLMERMTPVMHACDALGNEVRLASTPSPLRIGLLKTVATRPLANLVRTFKRANPHAAISLFEGDADDLQARLESSEIDAIITSSKPVRRTNAFKYLLKERYVLAVPLDHKLASESAVPLEVLKEEPIVSRTQCEMFKDTVDVLARRRIKPKVAYHTDQDDRAISLVAAGIGVAMVPELLDDPDVAQVPFSDFDLTRTISVQWKKGSQAKLVKDFVFYAASHRWGRARSAA